MTRKLRRLSRALLILNVAISCAALEPALAGTSEDVTVYGSPYTIHRQKSGYYLNQKTPLVRITVQKDVSYADLDLSKRVRCRYDEGEDQEGSGR